MRCKTGGHRVVAITRWNERSANLSAWASTTPRVSNKLKCATAFSWRASFFRLVTRAWKFFTSSETTGVVDNLSRTLSVISSQPVRCLHSEARCRESCSFWMSIRSPWSRTWSSIAMALARTGLRDLSEDWVFSTVRKGSILSPPNLPQNGLNPNDSTRKQHSGRFDPNNTVASH